MSTAIATYTPIIDEDWLVLEPQRLEPNGRAVVPLPVEDEPAPLVSLVTSDEEFEAW
jgi:hypothetical protein